MKKSCLLRTMSLSFMAAFLALALVPSAFCNQPESGEAKISPEYIVYYFYTSKRCSTCLKIEEWSGMAITEDLKDQVDAGRLQWQALNIEKPENEHFVKDFQLYTKSVIVAEYKDGVVVRWENLADIWKLAHDRDKFIDYVAGETQKFMKGD